MDPRIAEWQRQAEAAARANPEAKDAIEAQLREMVSGLSVEWARQGEAAVKAGANPDDVRGK